MSNTLKIVAELSDVAASALSALTSCIDLFRYKCCTFLLFNVYFLFNFSFNYLMLCLH